MKLSEDDARLFDELYRRHSQDVLRHCRRFSNGDEAWAMDRAHETFMKLARALPTITEPERLQGWLYRVSVTTCLMTLRKQRGLRGVVMRLSGLARPSLPSPEEKVQRARDAANVEMALGALPPMQHALMVLIYLDGKTQTEAADLLRISSGYASKLHSRAVSSLRKMEWEFGDA